jgi:hypothetical protein
MQIKGLIKIVYPAALTLFLIACGGGEKVDDTIEAQDTTSQAVQETKLNAQNVFNSMPDRKVILKLIEDNKVEYNADFLNDPQQVDKYTIENTKAANLGVYGSDLSIASAFEQTQESVVFLKCVNVLAGDLGVNGAFDQRMWERMDANKSNSDSTLEIITAAFKSADEILKSNNRPATSAIILSGAWVEGLYVSTKITESLNADGLAQSIIKQKESLKNLVIMLEASKLDERSAYILTDLKSLQESFKATEGSEAKGFELIKDIAAKVAELRKKLISGV